MDGKEEAREKARNCPTCNGRVFIVAQGRYVHTRQTVGMVCQTCGWDYGEDGEP